MAVNEDPPFGTQSRRARSGRRTGGRPGRIPFARQALAAKRPMDLRRRSQRATGSGMPRGAERLGSADLARMHRRHRRRRHVMRETPRRMGAKADTLQRRRDAVLVRRGADAELVQGPRIIASMIRRGSRGASDRHPRPSRNRLRAAPDPLVAGGQAIRPDRDYRWGARPGAAKPQPDLSALRGGAVQRIAANRRFAIRARPKFAVAPGSWALNMIAAPTSR
jgi:hypothetical protein